MTPRHRTIAVVAASALSFAACGRAGQAPAMNAADLSDDRGARAGRFLPDAIATANDTAPDHSANESNP